MGSLQGRPLMQPHGWTAAVTRMSLLLSLLLALAFTMWFFMRDSSCSCGFLLHELFSSLLHNPTAPAESPKSLKASFSLCRLLQEQHQSGCEDHEGGQHGS